MAALTIGAGISRAINGSSGSISWQYDYHNILGSGRT